MRATNTLPAERGGILTRTLAATALLLVSFFFISRVLRGPAPAAADLWLASAIAAAATVAIALLFLRVGSYRRGVYLGSVATLAAAVLLTPLQAVDPVSWARTAREMLWFYPWFFVVTQTATPNAARRACSGTAGWFLPASALLMGGLLHLTFAIAGR